MWTISSLLVFPLPYTYPTHNTCNSLYHIWLFNQQLNLTPQPCSHFLKPSTQSLVPSLLNCPSPLFVSLHHIWLFIPHLTPYTLHYPFPFSCPLNHPPHAWHVAEDGRNERCSYGTHEVLLNISIYYQSFPDLASMNNHALGRKTSSYIPISYTYYCFLKTTLLNIKKISSIFEPC